MKEMDAALFSQFDNFRKNFVLFYDITVAGLPNAIFRSCYEKFSAFLKNVRTILVLQANFDTVEFLANSIFDRSFDCECTFKAKYGYFDICEE